MPPSPEMLVERVNNLHFPPTIWNSDWIYGVWYCGTSWQKAIYYGQYPSTFVKRIKTMFPSEKMLHLCCGRCHIEGAINLDAKQLPEVDVVADAENLPFDAGQFDVVLIDPPYSEEDASRYGVKRLLNARRVMEEASRVLVPEGWLIWLDEKYPSYRRKDWKLRGLIGIVTGFERRTRVLSMFQNLKEVKDDQERLEPDQALQAERIRRPDSPRLGDSDAMVDREQVGLDPLDDWPSDDRPERLEDQ